MPRLPSVTAVLGFLSAASIATAQTPTSSDTIWHFQAPGDIQALHVCSSAQLLLTTKGRHLIALDAATGHQLWEKTDLPAFEWGLFFPCDGKTGLSYAGNKLVAFDLVSGQQRWDASVLTGMQEIRGFVILDDVDVLLLFLRTAATDRALAALRLSTGERLWQRDDLFQLPPAFAAHGGVSDIAEYQTFITGGDSSLFLYVTADGPVRLDLRTGATVWNSQAFAGMRVPDLGEYAGMVLIDSTLIVPQEKGLIALNASDGKVRWQNPTLLPRKPTRLARVPAGLLVRAGADYVNVLDLLTGTSRWQRPLTLRTDGIAYEIVGNRYFFVSHDRVLVADLESGDTTGRDKLQVKGNEVASQMLPSDGGLVVFSRQNLFRTDADGALRYSRYYKAPGTSFLQQMGGLYGNYGSAVISGKYAYFVTNEPDSAGRRGNSILRVLLDDGSEAGRVWLKEKGPTYWPDTWREQLLVLADDKTLVAMRFRN